MVDAAFIPPFDEQAEQAVLGAIFIDPSCLAEVARVLPDASMFWRTKHRKLYDRMLAHAGKDFDWLTIADDLCHTGEIDELGGKDALLCYLSDITSGVPSSYGAVRYAMIVRDKALKRSIALDAGDVRSMALDETKTADECVIELGRMATEHAGVASGASDEAAATVADGSLALFESGGIQSMTTGYGGLDRIGGGWIPGGLYIVAARPGQGKSALIGNMIERYQRSGVRVGICPLEMTNQQMMLRLVAVRAGVDSMLLREARLTGDDRARAVEEWRTLREGMWFNDRPGQNVLQIAAQARAWKRKHGIDILFIDYLQIMGALDASTERRLQIGEMTRGLKQLAGELAIPIIAASQINREAESRRKTDGSGGKPGLHNLKDAGSIEEDADGVIGIYRPKEPKPSEPTWEAEIGWMKNRHGGVGHVNVVYHRATTRFVESDNAIRRNEGAGVPDYAGGNGRLGADHARGDANVRVFGGNSAQHGARERRDLA